MEVQDSIARANDAAEEAVSGIRTVRGFRTEKSESCLYENRLIDTHKLKTQRDTVRAVYLLVRRVYLSFSTELLGLCFVPFLIISLNVCQYYECIVFMFKG